MSNDLGFRALIAFGAPAGFFVKSRRGNTILASLMIAAIVAYILVVFLYVSAGGRAELLTAGLVNERETRAQSCTTRRLRP